MKIAILTLQHSNNYGAMFQAYALSTFLERAGHEAYFINYHQDVPTLAGYARRPISLIGKILGKGALSPSFLRGKRTEARGKSVQQAFVEIFNQFRVQHLSITPRIVHFAELAAHCPDADAYIVGSDQVWAADFVFSSPAYLLSFTPDGARKISYAASFGKAKLERYLRKTFVREIKNFHAVSVREQSGVDIVEELAGRSAEHVLDPTLIISDYSEIVDYSLVPDTPYCLSYRLSQDEQLTRWTSEAVRSVAGELDLPVYSVSTNAQLGQSSDVRDLRPTPGQLLGLIERARFFITNSFHGTVFAINFRTPFLTLARDDAENRQNLRLTELLDLAGAGENFCKPFLDVREMLLKTERSPDFDAMHERLNARRETSIDFLKNALL